MTSFAVISMSESQLDFLRRSFFAVDGLWFFNCEGTLDFERALELDRTVWESMAKIQARKARELTGGQLNLEGLARALKLKFESEGWGFEVEKNEKEVRFHIITCPWYQILQKSGRTRLEPTITETICKTEYPLWGREFGEGISFSLVKESPGAGSCCMVFKSDEGKD